jgi:Uma2 family endonuclease
MPVSAKTYLRVVLEDLESRYELVCGRLYRKPFMTTEHAGIIESLGRQLHMQVDGREFAIRIDYGRLRVPGGNFRVPDVCVVPRAYVLRLRERPRTFEVFDGPVPLVVEVWSPSTGTYDVRTKLAEYQLRRDQKIWYIHPYQHTLTAWRLQADGTYAEQAYTTGVVQPVALPGVSIDIDRLWD